MSSELWKIVGNGGVTVYDNAEDLWHKAEDYFLWCDCNPVTSKRTLNAGKRGGDKVEVEHVRPYSLKGLCLFCGVNEAWLKDMSVSDNKQSLWYMVVEKIMYIIYNQNVEGAYVDLFNPIMVSKVLGLDKPEDTSGKVTRVEIVDSTSTKLANSENEILKNIVSENRKASSEKLESIKDKSEKLQEINTNIQKHISEDGFENVPIGEITSD